jgi:hypothetical protein
MVPGSPSRLKERIQQWGAIPGGDFPRPRRRVAEPPPLTHALRGLRATLRRGAAPVEVLPSLLVPGRFNPAMARMGLIGLTDGLERAQAARALRECSAATP